MLFLAFSNTEKIENLEIAAKLRNNNLEKIQMVGKYIN